MIAITAAIIHKLNMASVTVGSMPVSMPPRVLTMLAADAVGTDIAITLSGSGIIIAG